jgi:hypothetical protein
MSTRASGTYETHNGRPDPVHPGLFVCSRCGHRYNEDGQTVDKDGKPLEHPDDCTTKLAPGFTGARVKKAVVEREHEQASDKEPAENENQ